MLGLLGGCSLFQSQDKPARPNIILIMADDMGYSDIGCFGGEISTPNLDNLAKHGVRFKQFYNSARCCPTRASLLTGLNPHQTGMGWMTAFDYRQFGYTGELNNNCVTIAEVLKSAGYSSYMAGKWHLTHYDHVTQAGPNNSWPMQRGFEKFYGTLRGSGSFFKPPSLTDGNTLIEAPDTDYYYTDAITDHVVEYMDDHIAAKPEDPFFMYVAYTAPHYPLHAKPEDIAKYRGKYLEGWEKLREQRFDRMKVMGLLPEDTKLSPLSERSYAWDSLTDAQKDEMDKRMAIYAAQVDNMDQNIGRILENLKRQGKLDNTLIFFLSDNGASPEPRSKKDKSLEAMGTEASFESYGAPWANASNTPFRLFKSWIHEGGVITPLIVHWPKHVQPIDKALDTPGSITDIMATCVEVSGAKYPKKYQGEKIPAMVGTSLMPALEGKEFDRGPICWEHEANMGIRDGKWKLVSVSNKEEPYLGKLELYNIEEDRSEMNDLADQNPKKVKELYEKWTNWAEQNHVLPLDGSTYSVKAKKYSR
ncbi:arylsulfatase [Puteibacter caeruleilacunae]|nr:arylsulfatase [Puteibacter caeruleilacunae]